MQILLNIPDKYVSLDKSFQEMILEMNADGVRGIATILPKGHGRLGDIDKLIKEVEHFHKCPNGHSDVYDEAMIINFLDNAPTIIKADKESEE